MAIQVSVTIKIIEEEFIEEDGIYRWAWIYIGGKLKFSIYHKL